MNALDRYFERTGENVSRLAAKIGCPASTLTRPLRGKRDPSLKLARMVERATEGAVSAQEFIGICIGAQLQPEAVS